MFSLPGRHVLVSLADGSVVRGITRWSWGSLRLREVEIATGEEEPISAPGLFIVPVTAILMIQVVS